ncbi:squalene synthetase-like protein [Orobanche minor]
MGSLRAILRHPDDLYPMVKLKLAARIAERQIPAEPHWGFCYSMLHKVSRSFALVIQQLDTDLRDAVCIFYLVLRALDTVEDDTSIAADVKVPILMAFHQHIYDREWHFSCDKILAHKPLLLGIILRAPATVFHPVVTISIKLNHLLVN